MKKRISFFLALAMLLALCSMTAVAEVEVEGFQAAEEVAEGVTVTLDSAQPVEFFTVTYTGAEDGKQYMLFAFDHEVTIPTESDLLSYIDQAAASDGSVTFSGSGSGVGFAGAKSGTTYYIYMSSNAESGITGFTKVAAIRYETNYTLGNVNEDEENNIDVADAILALRIYAGDVDPTENQKSAADVNLDSKVDVADAIGILRYYAGDIQGFDELKK